MGRAGGLAGGCSLFGYAERPWYSLWILFENCLAGIEQFVVLVGAGNRTDFCALAAACAFCHVYKSGCLMNFCGKISGLAFEAQKFGVCEKLNIQMTADLDQFR
jgi:hypothetical protein